VAQDCFIRETELWNCDGGLEIMALKKVMRSYEPS